MISVTPFDRYIAAEVLKEEVDKVHKKAKLEAEDELARLRDENGSLSATSLLFGPGAGEFKYSQTRKKTIVEWNLADRQDFLDWCDENPDALKAYVANHAEDFGKFWTEETGEPVDGIARVEYEKPAGIGSPKIYRLDPGVVKGKLGVNLLDGMSQLLLEEGGDD